MKSLSLALAFLLVGSCHAQTWVTNGLVAYYPFNGNANDAAGTNHGVVQGAILTGDRYGKPNSAYLFNGGSWIETPQYRLLDGASNATITAWVVFAAGLSGQLLSAGDFRAGYDPISLSFNSPPSSFTDGINSSACIWFHNTQLGNSSSAQIFTLGCPTVLPGAVTNTWHQLAVVLDTTSTALGAMDVFLNGRPVLRQVGARDGVSSFTRISYDTNMRFLIGAVEGRPFYSSPGQFWRGKIDDVRIYSRNLSPSEVAQLYELERDKLTVERAVYVTKTNLVVGQTYQLQVSTATTGWTNVSAPFVATNTFWRSGNYWDVDQWGQLFFRLQPQ